MLVFTINITPELVLGTIGTITGVIGTIIAISALNKDKPKIKIEERNCGIDKDQVFAKFSIDNPKSNRTYFKKIEMIINNKIFDDNPVIFKLEDWHEVNIMSLPLEIPENSTQQLKIETDGLLPNTLDKTKKLSLKVKLYYTHGKKEYEFEKAAVLKRILNKLKPSTLNFGK